MVVRFENLWVAIPLMLIPITFAILMMGLVRVWMFNAPTKIRRRPKYSMHVLRDQKEPGYTNYGQRTATDNSRTLTSYSDEPNVGLQSYSDEGGRMEKILPARFYDEYPRQVITSRQNVASSGFASPSSGYGRKDYDERSQVLTEAKFI